MSARVKRIKIFGEGINAKSPTITRQRRLNCYLEVRKDQDRTNVTCIGTPGLRLLFNASTPANLPVRGMLGNDTAFYLVAGNQVASLSQAGSVLSRGNIGTATGRVEITLNPTQVLLVDGTAGYLFNPTTGAVTTPIAGFPNGARTCIQCNGFGVAELPGTNQFFVSNFNDFSVWSGLSFASATQAIDGIQAVDSLNGLLIVFSAGHGEFWQNAGLAIEPFIYVQNSAFMYGLAAIGGRTHVADMIVYLARTNGGSFMNSSGSYQFCAIKGYKVQVVSTPDIDNILQTMARESRIDDCVAMSWQSDSHCFAQFSFPTANRTLLYDATEGLWGEMQTGVTPLYTARHLGNYSAQAFRQTYVSDYSNGNVYTFDPTVFTDNGNIILRELITRCAMEDMNYFKVPRIIADVNTGRGYGLPGAQSYDPVQSWSMARDGRNFGVERIVKLGQIGDFSQKVTVRRWGRMRYGNLRIRQTDPVSFIVNNLYAHAMANMSGTNQGGRK